MKIKFLLSALAAALSIYTYVEVRAETVTTEFELKVEKAKGSHLRARTNEVVSMVMAKRFVDAEKLANALRKNYEAEFSTHLRQFSFPSQVEFDEFRKSTKLKFEWVDWGYKECLQMLAFIQSERRDFPAALNTLKEIERIAPVSAGTVIEIGYVLNQLGMPDKGLAAYQKARALSLKYKSQRSFHAIALRGMGFSLIDLKRLDEAEGVFRESLKLEPMNKVALSELAYIQDIRNPK